MIHAFWQGFSDPVYWKHFGEFSAAATSGAIIIVIVSIAVYKVISKSGL